MPRVVLFKASNSFSRDDNISLLVKSIRQVFNERITHKMFYVSFMHNKIKPLWLHDVIWQVYDAMSAGQFFEEISTLEPCFQIMIKLLSWKNMMMWVHPIDYVVNIKLNLEHMQWIWV